jgi:hypothetical protein
MVLILWLALLANGVAALPSIQFFNYVRANLLLF